MVVLVVAGVILGGSQGPLESLWVEDLGGGLSVDWLPSHTEYTALDLDWKL